MAPCYSLPSPASSISPNIAHLFYFFNQKIAPPHIVILSKAKNLPEGYPKPSPSIRNVHLDVTAATPHPNF
jgi:hypothetical protein